MSLLEALKSIFTRTTQFAVSTPAEPTPAREREKRSRKKAKYVPGKAYPRKLKWPLPNLEIGEVFVGSQDDLRALVDASCYWRKKLGMDFTVRTSRLNVIVTRTK